MAAVAEFSELWMKGGQGEDRLRAAMNAAYAADADCIAWLAHRDLKADDHLLIYKLFADRAAFERHDGAGFGDEASTVVCELAPTTAPRRSAAPEAGAVAIFVQCGVDDMAAFEPSMSRHVTRTLETEPGCLAFGWHRTPDDRSAVQLFELYASREDLSAHRRSAQLALFRGESEHLMLKARIHYAALAMHAPLDRLRTFFGDRT